MFAKAGRPMARLLAHADKIILRTPGGWEGQVWIADDFDSPLPEELLVMFEGEREASVPRIG